MLDEIVNALRQLIGRRVEAAPVATSSSISKLREQMEAFLAKQAG